MNETNKRSSQNKLIKAYMMLGHNINGLQALHYFNCERLAARIHDIRKTTDVQSEWVVTESKKRIKRYFIKK